MRKETFVCALQKPLSKWWLISFLLLFQLLSIGVFAQQKRVEGTVTDAKGSPLEGASVTVKGSSTGVVTDNKGKYSVSAELGATLVFSYAGSLTREEKIGASSNLNIGNRTIN